MLPASVGKKVVIREKLLKYLVFAWMVQLEEFRKKKDKSAHAAALVQEDENGTTEEEGRPDPNIWRRALEVNVVSQCIPPEVLMLLPRAVFAALYPGSSD